MAGGGPNSGNQRFNKSEDADSGIGSSSEAHIIRHIDRNILACQICQNRYKDPKVRLTCNTVIRNSGPVRNPSNSHHAEGRVDPDDLAKKNP
jgi:hypothetical protein